MAQARSPKRKKGSRPATGAKRKAARARAPSRPDEAKKVLCPIVAMGASAGGLEAFQRFFARMPADSGMAFILVQHLDIHHKSAMTDLIHRYTKMDVVEITDGMPVAENRVHVIPPNAILTIARGVLRIVRPRDRPLTIDTFLRSLAEDQEENAIAVILSGSGSDGTQGIKAIKEHGGLTVAQTGQSAGYDSMPVNAVATGQVDFVLPVEDMPARLVEYAHYLRALREGERGQNLRDEARSHLVRIYTLLRTKTGHDFSRYKDSTFIRRVRRRMQVSQTVSVSDYVELLRKDPHEIDLLFRDLLIGVTHFFRDAAVFDALAREVIPSIIANKGPGDQIRVWIPGCATGEEAFTIAILLREQLAQNNNAIKVQIFATDIDEDALDTARTGRYPESIARDLSPERLERYFIRDGEYYRVVKDVREMCIFSVHNVIRDAPFSKLDLVSCRNLLIYLDVGLQNRIIPIFHFALRHGGYLLLGSSENVTQHPKLFMRIDARHRIFKARQAAFERLALDVPLSAGARQSGGGRTGASPMPAEEGISRRAMRAIEAYTPAFVVVDEHDDIVHFSGRTGKYLQPSPGAATFNLFNVLESSLRPDVRTALREAATTGNAVVHAGIQIPSESGGQKLNVVVEPLAGPDASAHYFVIAFQDLGAVIPRQIVEPSALKNPQRDDTVAQLESELRTTRERLQATIEELETSNEEMKASNEEFQSINEELQSANEELETSKEELQSINEELETVNAELNSKVESLERAHNDRKNLLESTQIATIFLDGDLRVKSFTPAIIEIFNLRESDVGREITDFVLRIIYANFARDVRKVLRTLSRVEQEVMLADGSATYLMRILPYRTTENVIDGVVVTFIDINDRKRAEEDRARLAAIVQDSYDAVFGLTLDGTITNWNAGAERMYGYTAAEAVSRSISIIIPSDRDSEPKSVVERIRRGRAAAAIETQRLTKDGRRITVTSTISPIRSHADKLVGASAIERDDTERKLAVERQAMLLTEINNRVKNALAGVLSISNRTLRNSGSLDDYREAFEGRVRALAKTHELLAASSWQGADLREVVAAELALYQQHGNRAAIMGEKVMLRSNAALALGMVLHELATNAAKHGALSVQAGRIEVGWEIDTRARMLQVRWVEQGGPAPAHTEQRPQGVGMQFIERAVTSELRGTAKPDFSDGGCRWAIAIPLDDALIAPPGTDGAGPG